MTDTATETPLPTIAPARPRPQVTPQTRPQPRPSYAVVLHNDPINGFDFVVRCLRQVFHYGGAYAFWLTLKAHCAGRAVVWRGVLEVAELKAEQLRDCGPDPRMLARGARPLTVTVEPLAGGGS